MCPWWRGREGPGKEICLLRRFTSPSQLPVSCHASTVIAFFHRQILGARHFVQFIPWAGGRIWMQVHHWRPRVHSRGPYKTRRKSLRVRVGRTGTHCQEVSLKNWLQMFSDPIWDFNNFKVWIEWYRGSWKQVSHQPHISISLFFFKLLNCYKYYPARTIAPGLPLLR